MLLICCWRTKHLEMTYEEKQLSQSFVTKGTERKVRDENRLKLNFWCDCVFITFKRCWDMDFLVQEVKDIGELPRNNLKINHWSVFCCLPRYVTQTGSMWSDGRIFIGQCDMVESWDNLSLSQKKNLNYRYQMGCECRVSDGSGSSQGTNRGTNNPPLFHHLIAFVEYFRRPPFVNHLYYCQWLWTLCDVGWGSFPAQDNHHSKQEPK